MQRGRKRTSIERRTLMAEIRRCIGQNMTDDEMMDQLGVQPHILLDYKRQILEFDRQKYNQLDSVTAFSDYAMKIKTVCQELDAAIELCKERKQGQALVNAIWRKKEAFDSLLKWGQEFGFVAKKASEMRISSEFSFSTMSEEQVQKEIKKEIKKLNEMTQPTIEMRPEVAALIPEQVRESVPQSVAKIPEVKTKKDHQDEGSVCHARKDMTGAPITEQIGDQALSVFREKQKRLDMLRKKKLTRRDFLRDQILNHDRIDLLMTELLGYTVQDFHAAMYYCIRHNSLEIENVPGQSQRWNLSLAPRGFGKSTILTVSRCVLEILKNPNIRILIASKTDTNAVGFLTEIKQKLVRKDLVDIFGQQMGAPWNDGNIRVKPRTSDSKEDTIQTIGLGGALVSKHVDLVIGDDLIDEANSATEGLREKIHTWFFKVLFPCLEPHGEMSIIGTRYHPEDLLGNLIENVFTIKDADGKPLRYCYKRFPAIMPKDDADPHAKEVEKYISLWPEKFSVKFLLGIREQMGTIIFNSQYMNDVEAMKGKIFKIDWFQWYHPKDINLRDLRIFQGVDLAIKQQENADKFASVTIGVHPKTKNVYVLDYHNAVEHYNDQKRIIKNQFTKFDPIRVAIEANGYQRSILQDMNTDEELSNIRAVPIFTEKDKTVRAWKLSAYFERSQVFLRVGMNELQEQLLKMPDGRYKDLFDALDIAVTCAFFGAKRVRDSEPGVL